MPYCLELWRFVFPSLLLFVPQKRLPPEWRQSELLLQEPASVFSCFLACFCRALSVATLSLNQSQGESMILRCPRFRIRRFHRIMEIQDHPFPTAVFSA